MVEPVEEAGAGFVAHALAELRGLRGVGEELGQKVVDELLGARLGLPGELVEGFGDSKGHLHLLVSIGRTLTRALSRRTGRGGGRVR